MANTAKPPKGKTEALKQLKMSDYNLRGEATKTSTAMAPTSDAKEAVVDDKADQILAALESMKNEFTTKLDDMAITLQDVKKELKDSNERISRAEERISTAEDEVLRLQAKMCTLQAKNKMMENKVIDLESRSRLNNLRLVNLKEGVEGQDVCAFLERWLLEALGEQLRSPIVLERAHRIGPKNDKATRPRVMIMRFLNFKDTQAVLQATRGKKVYFEDKEVLFYSDLATGVLELRKKFDPVREELRKLRLRHGVAHPATLLVTYEGTTHAFKTPAEAHVFLTRVRDKMSREEH